MPRDQTFVLVCKCSDLVALFERLEQALLPWGFTRGKEAVVTKGEDAPDAEPESNLVIQDLVAEEALLRDYASIYFDFNSPKFSLGIQFDRSASEFICGYIFINRQTIYHLHKQQIPSEFYALISNIAEAAKAMGGYAGFEASYHQAAPEKILSMLISQPRDSNLKFDIYMFENSQLSSMAAEVFDGEGFKRLDGPRFTFFVDGGFLSLCEEFG